VFADFFSTDDKCRPNAVRNGLIASYFARGLDIETGRGGWQA
jgi:hypothetical protein